MGPQVLTDLGKALPDLSLQDVTVLSLDVSKVAEFDSQSLEALLEFDALVRSRGLDFELSRPSEVLALALKVTGLSERLDVLEAELESTAQKGPAS